jgi:hypothetical protein
MKQIEAGKLNAMHGKCDTFENIFTSLTKGEKKKKEDEDK